MSNARQIAGWVKSLNSKPTKCVQSEWMPSKLDMRFHSANGKYDSLIKKAASLALDEKSSGKTVVFVHSKITGKKIARRIVAAGQPCAFHNASLSPAKRKDVEKRFGDPISGLNILVSTSTLGTGVNIGE